MSDSTEIVTRSIEIEVQIDASADAVWAALTDADQLQSWFPLEARVEPGVGGSMFLSWGPGMEGEGAIEVWEPGRHLCVVEHSGTDDAGRPVRIAVDYHIESRDGTTVLRLVHSGFSADAEWSEYYDTTESGWTYFLWHLQFYLRRHRGVPRRMAWTRLETNRSRQEVWERLVGPGGLALSGSDGTTIQHPGAGHACTLSLDRSDRDRGELVVWKPGVHLAVTMAGLNDAVLLVELEPGTSAWHLGIWLSVYGLAAGGVGSLARERR